MQKKMLAILLTLCMLLGVFPFAIMAEETTGEVVDDTTTTTESETGEDDGSGDTVTDTTEVDLTNGIDNEAELLALMADSTLWGDSYVLNKDIVLPEGSAQAPIGNTTTQFTGTFDGQGHSISGINLVTTDDTVTVWGLFGYIDGATVQNLKTYGTVSCTSTGVGSTDLYNGVGGIIGLATKSVTLKNLENHCNVTGTSTCAGILGHYKQISAANVVNVEITNVRNYGDVTTTGMYNGGIFGRVDGQNSGSFVVDGAYNEGAISSTSTTNKHYVAGICGLWSGYNSTSTGVTHKLKNAWNAGSITGASVGGIIGFQRNFMNTKTDVAFSNIMNSGALKETNGSTTVYFGGIVAYGNNSHGAGWDNVYSIGAMTRTGTATNYVSAIDSVNNGDSVWTNSYYDKAKVGFDSYRAANGTALPTDEPHSNYLTAANGWTALLDGTVELTAFHSCVDEKINETNEEGTDGLCDTCGANLSCSHEGTERVTKVNTAATCNSTGLDDVYCICGEYLETVVTDIDPTNHATTTVYAKANGTQIGLYADCCNGALHTVDAITDVYVDAANGVTLAVSDTDVTGIGTEAKPFKDLYDAAEFAAAATAGADNVTIHIVGEYSTAGKAFYMPECEEMLTITGDGEDANSIKITGDNGIYASGPLTLKDLYINNLKNFHLTGRNHELIVDSGVKVQYSDSQHAYLYGGFNGGANPDGTGLVEGNVTVRSGDWHIVSAGSRSYSGTVVGSQNNKLTIGAGENDTLIIHSLYPVAVNYQRSEEDILVTMKIDGPVQVGNFYAVSCNATASTEGTKYDVDLLLDHDIQGIITVTEAAAETDTDSALFTACGTNHQWGEATEGVATCSVCGGTQTTTEAAWTWLTVGNETTVAGTFTVYEKSGAVASDVDVFQTIGNLEVVKSTYAVYCVNKMNGHFTTETNKVCTNCGTDTATACDHGDLTADKFTHTHTPATCNTVAVDAYLCALCGVTETVEGTEFDADNHASNTNFVWAKNAETGENYIDCSACENNIVAETPAVYVDSANGDDANDGFTGDTAVATLTEAVERIAATGGTVLFMEMYDLNGAEITLPDWGDNVITFRSGLIANSKMWNDAEAVAADPRPIRGIANTASDLAELHLGGAAIFESIYFKGANVATADLQGEIRIFANWHDIEFGYIRTGSRANIYVVAGASGITADDTTPADVTVTLKGVGNTDSTKDTNFYDVVYLGSTLGKDGLTVANKKVTLNIEHGIDWNVGETSYWQAKIGTVYMSSSSAVYAAAALTDYEVVVNQKNDSQIATVQVLNKRVSQWLPKLTYNLLDDSTFSTTTEKQFINCEDVTINVSDKDSGRTTAISNQLGFFGYGNDEKQQNATVAINYGCGSFTRAEAPKGIYRTSTIGAAIGCTSDMKTANGYTEAEIYAAAEKAITLNHTGAEHEWGEGDVTTAPAAGKDGERTYTCADCSKTYTAVEPWSCEKYGHNYVATTEGVACTYGCSTAYAAGNLEVKINATEVTKGGTVTVPVLVTTKANIAAATFTVDLPEGLTMTGWEPGLEATESGDELNSGWQILGSDPVDNVYADPCMFAILYLGTEEVTDADGNTETVLGDALLGENVVVATLMLTAADDFAGGTISITVEEAYDADEVAVTTTTVSAAVTATDAPVAGDVTGEGDLTIVDALLILKALLNETVADLANADANQDGEFGLADVIRVLNSITTVTE